jgi:ribosomal protein S12 methylthiotransferase accessory factor
MRKVPRPLLEASLTAFARAVGVTRIARLTGLDRTGVEVASAIRPTGHVLQVTNGKGETFLEAARGALGEATELWAAERVRTGAWGTAAEVEQSADGANVLGADAGELRVAWCRATRLSGGAALVPAPMVFCGPEGTALLGAAEVAWTSNGMGAHPSRDAALQHALLEAIERDQLARGLPEGFTGDAIQARMIDPASLARAAPRTAALAAGIERRGFGVYLFDAGPETAGRGADALPPDLDLGLPVAAALLVDRAGGPVPVAAGYACRLSRDEALRAALLEAAQSRATEIHGAREDVLHGDRDAAAALAEACLAASPRRPASAMSSARAASPRAAVRLLLDRLRAAGREHVAAVDLDAPAGQHVVKVLVPGLLLSELL